MELLHQVGEGEEEHQLQEEVVVAGEPHQLALGVEEEGGLRGLYQVEGEAGECSKMGVAAEELEGLCLMEEVVAAEEEVRSKWEGEAEAAAGERLMKVVVEGAPHWMQVGEV